MSEMTTNTGLQADARAKVRALLLRADKEPLAVLMKEWDRFVAQGPGQYDQLPSAVGGPGASRRKVCGACK